MQITVRFFGIVGDVTRRKDQSIELPAGAIVSTLVDTIAAGNKPFAAIAGQLRAVVNGQNAARDTVLNEGDDVVLMRAIGGGS